MYTARTIRTRTRFELLTPAEIYRYEIEVFPLGHVFRAGHRLLDPR